MYLKSVEMQGFKSFADKIHLDFNSGITAIVGPNGSGKSNISDAIRWVLGEQSIKSLRGSKMEDVIFSGTQERNPLGFAEVSLTIDNTSGVFPVEYNEITISRRLYRSGESEYLINKTPCRLKDIHEFFMDTGLGKEGYSVIGQGRIDEILSNKSEDRRYIFEEAAGITKYKYRKAEAEKKLVRTAENLDRIADIMSELKAQLDPLKEQSEKAKKYLVLRDELKILDVNISVIEVKKSKSELYDNEKNIKDALSEIDAVESGIKEDESKINLMYDEIKDTEELIENLRKSEKQSISDINGYTNKINILTANIEHINENISRTKNDIEKSKGSRDHLESILADCQKRIMELEAEKSVKEEILKENEKNSADFENRLQEMKRVLELKKHDAAEKNNEISSLNEKKAAAHLLIKNFEERKENLKSQKHSQNEKVGDIRNHLKSLGEEKEEKENELSALKIKKFDLEKIYSDSQLELKELSEKKFTIEKSFSEHNTRKSVLEEMERDFEGYGKSVKSVMSAYKNGRIKNAVIYGPLSSLIHTDEKYITAIEIALQSASQNIVTETEEDAKAAIEFLKSTNSGRATFLPLSAVKPRKFERERFSSVKGFVSLASELVSADSKYLGLVNSILGATVVADSYESAVNIAKKGDYKVSVVTLQGELIRPGGSITGGSMNKINGFLSRAAEIERLDAKILNLQNELKDFDLQYKTALNKNLELADKNDSLAKEIAAFNEEYIKTEADYSNYKELLNSFEKGEAEIEKELSEVISVIENTKADIINFDKEIEINKISISEYDAEVLKLETDMAEFENNLTKIRENLIESNLNLKSVIMEIEHQSERYDDIAVQRDNAENVNKEREAEIEENIKNLEDIKKEIAELEYTKVKLFENNELNSKRIAELTEKKKDVNDKIRLMQEENKETRDKFYTLKNYLTKLETKKNKIENDLDAYIDRLWQDYELTFSEAEKLSKNSEQDFNPAKAKRRIEELKNLIKGLGNINIDAIEGYKSVKERYDFLVVQTEDLKKSKVDLEKIIAELLAVMKKQFKEQFAVINKNFQTVFKELFGGGTAKLELSDPSDLLESGIEIEVQPPGKKLQRLSLLSGGERAFTAIALLFAILKVRPTPFCILDEIEAALDDVNVFRFAAYLKKYSEKTQFIVVTHRRGTMEAANILYGVTMQERGVSKLLSLNIDEVTE